MLLPKGYKSEDLGMQISKMSSSEDSYITALFQNFNLKMDKGGSKIIKRKMNIIRLGKRINRDCKICRKITNSRASLSAE